MLDEEREYLEGKAEAYRQISLKLIEGITSAMPSTAIDINSRLIIKSAINDSITNINRETPFIESSFGKGAKEALWHFKDDVL